MSSAVLSQERGLNESGGNMMTEEEMLKEAKSGKPFYVYDDIYIKMVDDKFILAHIVNGKEEILATDQREVLMSTLCLWMYSGMKKWDKLSKEEQEQALKKFRGEANDDRPVRESSEESTSGDT